ncbi:hypothetical protein BGZ94_009956 [Podila epigama]|nr:hypothetical protein BGZ94_009956 [Podila epigama]
MSILASTKNLFSSSSAKKSNTSSSSNNSPAPSNNSTPRTSLNLGGQTGFSKSMDLKIKNAENFKTSSMAYAISRS